MTKPTPKEIADIYNEHDSATVAYENARAACIASVTAPPQDRLRLDIAADDAYARLRKATDAKFELVQQAKITSNTKG